jgi:hypothetical protein
MPGAPMWDFNKSMLPLLLLLSFCAFAIAGLLAMGVLAFIFSALGLSPIVYLIPPVCSIAVSVMWLCFVRYLFRKVDVHNRRRDRSRPRE